MVYSKPGVSNSKSLKGPQFGEISHIVIKFAVLKHNLALSATLLVRQIIPILDCTGPLS